MATSCGFESHRPHQPSLASERRLSRRSPTAKADLAASYGLASHALNLKGRREMPSQKNDRIAELPAIDVIYETGEKGRPISEQAPAAFDRLEARLSSLKGKKFYGAVIDGQYRACAAIDEDAAGIDLPRWVIPGG